MSNFLNDKINNLIQNLLSKKNSQNNNIRINHNQANIEEQFPHVGLIDFNQKVELEKIVGYKINNIALFEQAIIHRSFLSVISKFAYKKNIDPNTSNESANTLYANDWNITPQNYKNIKSNERLEFLGDSVLELVTSEFLFIENVENLEGDLSKTRSKLVRKETLIACCQELKLDEFIKLNHSARNSLNNGNHSILSDLLEATIAAIYLDAGLDQARDFIITKILPFAIKNFIDEKNYKSLLMEYVQAKGKNPPIYETINEAGPDHQKEFKVGVYVDDKLIAEGNGKSKKIAEQDAAKNAFQIYLKN